MMTGPYLMAREHTLTYGGEAGLGNSQIPATCDVLLQEADAHPEPHSGCQQGPVAQPASWGPRLWGWGLVEAEITLRKPEGERGKVGPLKDGDFT